MGKKQGKEGDGSFASRRGPQQVDRQLAFIEQSLEVGMFEQFEIVTLILLLAQIFHRRNEKLAKELQLELDDLFTLYTVGAVSKNRTLTPSHIASAWSITPAAASKRLKRLSDLGLITRTLANDDKRKVIVMLTAKGRARVAKMWKLERDPRFTFTWITDELNADEMPRLTAKLRRLTAAGA